MYIFNFCTNIDKNYLCTNSMCMSVFHCGLDQVITCDAGTNPVFALLKQRYSTEASLQHGNLCDSPPGRLPQPVGRNGQQQLCPHQRWRQGLREAEEKRPDVSTPTPSVKW